MILDSLYFNETSKKDDDVTVAGMGDGDTESEEAQDKIADEINANLMGAALENMLFFEGGEEALQEFCRSEEVQVLVESRRMPKKTFVRLGQNDDLHRRENMACLIVARERKDPLFKQLALNRVKERKIRNAIYKKYCNIAKVIAKKSQKKHIVDMKKMKSLPAITIR